MENFMLSPPAEKEWRRREQRDEEGDDEDGELADELLGLRALQRQELNKVRAHKR